MELEGVWESVLNADTTHLKEGGSVKAENQKAGFGSNEAAKEMVEYCWEALFSFHSGKTPKDSSAKKMKVTGS